MTRKIPKRSLFVMATCVTLMAATPALAEPFCGNTARIAELEQQRNNPAGPVMLASHRAGHLKAPENSLAAVDEAVAAGADFIEIDVRVSSDGVPFIMHDSTVTRTTGAQGTGEDMTYAELRKLRLQGSDEPPPTLLEVLRHSCGRVLVILDMKTDRIAPVVATVQGLGMLDQVQMFDDDSNVLRASRQIAPQLEVMTRLRVGRKLDEIDRGLAPVQIVHGDPQSLTPEFQRKIKQIPARIWANALGDTDEAMASGAKDTCAKLNELTGMGVSVIQTDYPALLRQTLHRCRDMK
ncbi:hypothetical protein GRI39_05095 [Altererythrobacter indicus]|uniref:GP-PDE domain-containing protein n=1 Tax=Altericroceibacterium indicum TaxID=374177 RepID=A0A845A7X2_9SPHN|nr:glycerophosphodiester phosphodiesterase family protein [Altericroceibacterium indicum]MXP25419.1 hypothetical protein [Altericroceibacterium indicum]